MPSLVVDTHSVLWYIFEDPRLSVASVRALDTILFLDRTSRLLKKAYPAELFRLSHNLQRRPDALAAVSA